MFEIARIFFQIIGLAVCGAGVGIVIGVVADRVKRGSWFWERIGQ